MLQLLNSYAGPDRAAWGNKVDELWKSYVALLFNIDVSEFSEPSLNDREKLLSEYYEKVVKTSTLSLVRDRKTGTLQLSGASDVL